MSDYWSERIRAAQLIPLASRLPGQDRHQLKEKGRKGNYRQFNVMTGKTDKIERLLDQENIHSFLEVSLRAQSCPMPFNCDVWDGLRCPFRCRYCYADYFKHSLYTSFFDNYKKMGLRVCSPDNFRRELDELLPHRGEPVSGNQATVNAIRLGIPIRLGIRFEDFPPAEKRRGVSLELLRYLADASYPVMINTKSALVGQEEYVEALANNSARAAVHMTMISSDEKLVKSLEPGAPSFHDRLGASQALVDAGVRVVARIEPWMMFINDSRESVTEYIDAIKEAGIQDITFDSYSYSANAKGIARNFEEIGIDFERMFRLSSDSQWLSSYLLGKFMDRFRAADIHVSTFDQGNVPDNDDWICCSVGDWFGEKGAGFNWGSGVIAIQFIAFRDETPTRWSNFERFVLSKGGWLSDTIRNDVKHLWNGEGDMAWPIYWSRGLSAIGSDEDGIVWNYRENDDFRKELWKGMTG